MKVRRRNYAIYEAGAIRGCAGRILAAASSASQRAEAVDIVKEFHYSSIACAL
jgi:hypothetical protein